jgi:hypothetical protein
MLEGSSDEAVTLSFAPDTLTESDIGVWSKQGSSKELLS